MWNGMRVSVAPLTIARLLSFKAAFSASKRAMAPGRVLL
jgi:hypothetical protein